MEEEIRQGEGLCQLFDLIPNGRNWILQRAEVEKKLELRLGLPGGEDWSAVQEKREHPVDANMSLGHISKVPKNTNIDASSGATRGFLVAAELETEGTLPDKMNFQQQQQLGFLKLQVKGKELLLQRSSRSGDQQSLEGKVCGSHPSSAKNAVVAHSNSQSRAVATPVVGWPPIRSFRKNLTATVKTSAESPNESSVTMEKLENDRKSLFVKIYMDGIPIGRKVDLKAYDSYHKLSLAVEELFRGLIAAQMEPLAASTQKNTAKTHTITGLLDGSGEYTLVYEDDEGDQMLVGDVPWEMFVSAATRLRVLKSSDLSVSSLGASSRRKTAGS